MRSREHITCMRLKLISHIPDNKTCGLVIMVHWKTFQVRGGNRSHCCYIHQPT